MQDKYKWNNIKFAAGAFVVFSCAGISVAAAADATVTLGRVAKTSTAWPEFVASDHGEWAKSGIKLDQVQIGVSEGVQALGAGSLNAMHGPCNSMVSYAAKGGKDTTMVFVTVAPHPGVVIAGKSIKSASDLKDKVIGVASVNSGSTVLVRELLAEKGLPVEDQGIVGGQGTPQLYRGLAAGAYDAVYSIPPFSSAAKADGYTVLGSFSEVAPKVPFTCVAMNTKWVEENGETARNFVKTWLAGVAWLNDPANEEEATSILQRELKLEPKVAATTYDEMVGESTVFPGDGRLSEEAYQAMTKIMVEGGELDEAPEGTVDDYFTDKLLP